MKVKGGFMLILSVLVLVSIGMILIPEIVTQIDTATGTGGALETTQGAGLLALIPLGLILSIVGAVFGFSLTGKKE